MKKDFKINIKFNFNLSVPEKDIQISIINGDNFNIKLIEKKCYEKLNKPLIISFGNGPNS